MISNILSIIANTKAVKELKNETAKYFVTDDVIGTALLACSYYKESKNNLTVITSNLYNAQRVYDIISSIIGENECFLFPVDELLRSDSIAASKEMIVQRLYVLNELQTKERYILVTHSLAVMSYLPDPKLFKETCLNISVGDKIDLQSIKEKLITMGYSHVHKLDHSLQFANRGDILDVYSVNNEQPIRIELFDDVVESIRIFSLNTQVSADSITSVKILPANEFLFNKNEIENFEKKIRYEADIELKQLNNSNISCFFDDISFTIEAIKNKTNINLLKKYYSFLQNKHFSVLDYTLNSKIIIANDEQVLKVAENIYDESINFLMEESKEHKILNCLSLYRQFTSIVDKNKCIYINEFNTKKDAMIFPIRSIAGSAMSINQAYDLIKNYYQMSEKLIICLDNEQQFEIIKSSLEQNDVKFELLPKIDLPKGKLGLVKYNLDEGFEIVDSNVIFLTSKELFSFKTRSSKFVNRYKEAVAIKSEQDLTPGDYVVHEQHGVGKFLDIVTMEIDNMHRDFIHIQYAGTDVLYVPLEQFRLIRKFVGKEGIVPKLNRLGSGEWEKTKNKIKERINEMADRLFKLYSEREQIQGFAFKKDDEFQISFERQFPYALTKDQETCLKEIKSDMEKSEPMDRLLCGDVGFGKTEIAFRAAFKAILSGKQVAILCPTTLLARQHYERALERFGPFDVRIAIFSRLIPEDRQKLYIKEVESGSCHLIIGTHRLLSKEIHFNNLGLLIVDEEQRFGVEQKEIIKELKKNVDVLTLTATPIPRTLQMSLVGIRALSQINTPPINRMPIQTYVMPQKDDVVFELIQRELSRKGQVFYLHNQISNIYSIAMKLEKNIKGASIGVIHGQMDKNEIEDIMINFYNGKIDILVCTSIIETGIDIPNVNMIIIEDSDKFGLSQLYQIKGRVGRGDRIAYAYLLYKPNKVLNENARKRLKAISDFTELGSGYKIAQRDLLIRGAGDILGPEQAGFIDTVGIDMYIQLLKETIEERQTGIKKNRETSKNQNNITVDAYIPSDYIDTGDKIDIYQEIDKVNTLEELFALKEKIRDIYGRLPKSVDTLFNKREIVFIVDNNESFDALNEQNNFIDIILSEKFSSQDSIGVILFNALTKYLKYIKVTYTNKHIKIRLFKVEKWLSILKNIVYEIMELPKNNKNTEIR